MILFKTQADLSHYLSPLLAMGRSTGFVPTMGALHQGHLSLIAESVARTEITVCSIFVNPTQFNDPADFEKYPSTIEHDIRLLVEAGCHILFLPSVSEIYPNGTGREKKFNLGTLDSMLEGSHRPGHFQGVCQVVYRLLEIVKPGFLFLGRKDLQQCMVIQRLINISGWDIHTVLVPIVREPGGLAMSSRNSRLSVQHKQQAVAISRALMYLQRSIEPGSLDKIIKTAEMMILAAGFDKIDYIVIASSETLEILTEWNGQTSVTGLVAAFIGGIRLIDNMPLGPHEK